MSTLTDTQVSASAPQDRVSAGLGLLVVAGLYADGWAHVNIGGLDSFFTPWHGLFYGSFVLLTGWIGLMTWSQRRGSSTCPGTRSSESRPASKRCSVPPTSSCWSAARCSCRVR